MKWAPISLCQKQARVKRGLYKCAGCGAEVPASVKDENGRRKKNIHVDHINPIVDPSIGWTTWDDCIERMFCELDNLQVLCGDCHEVKSNAEKQIAKERRAQEKENNGE